MARLVRSGWSATSVDATEYSTWGKLPMVSFALIGKGADALGLDADAVPTWVAVGTGVTRRVLVKDAAGLTIALHNPGEKAFLTVSEDKPTADGRVLVVTGGPSPKTVIVDFNNSSGKPVASLEVAVKKPAVLSTFIAFLFDSKHRTTPLGLDGALQIMGIANKILEPQTNLKMVRTDSGGFRLPFELPHGVPADFPPFTVPRSWVRGGNGLLPCIASVPAGPDGCLPESNIGLYKAALENAKVTLAPDKLKEEFEGMRVTQTLTNICNRIESRFDFTIIFCADFDRSLGGLGATTGAYTPPNFKGTELPCCLMPPVAKGQSLAHELCHYLLRTTHVGPGRHSTGRKDLMNQAPGLDSLNITKSQANFINPSP